MNTNPEQLAYLRYLEKDKNYRKLLKELVKFNITDSSIFPFHMHLLNKNYFLDYYLLQVENLILLQEQNATILFDKICNICAKNIDVFGYNKIKQIYLNCKDYNQTNKQLIHLLKLNNYCYWQNSKLLDKNTIQILLKDVNNLPLIVNFNIKKANMLLVKAGICLSHCAYSPDKDIQLNAIKKIITKGDVSRYNSLLQDKDPDIRVLFASQGVAFDMYKEDSNKEVRKAALESQAAIKSSDPAIRIKLVGKEDGKYNKDLMLDQDHNVRIAVIKDSIKNKHFDIVKHYTKDKNDQVRVVAASLAHEFYAKDFLKDKCVEVRKAIAKNGYYFNILANDPSIDVCREVANACNNNTKQETINKLIATNDNEIFYILASKMICINEIFPELSDKQLINIFTKNLDKLDLLNFENITNLAFMGNKKINDIIMKNPNDHIRAAVVPVASKNQLSILKDDPSAWVRATVASTGNYLEELINDPAWEVRANVARQGYGLDKLLLDDNMLVVNCVDRYCVDHKDTLLKDQDFKEKITQSIKLYKQKHKDAFTKDAR